MMGSVWRGGGGGGGGAGGGGVNQALVLVATATTTAVMKRGGEGGGGEVGWLISSMPNARYERGGIGVVAALSRGRLPPLPLGTS